MITPLLLEFLIHNLNHLTMKKTYHPVSKRSTKFLLPEIIGIQSASFQHSFIKTVDAFLCSFLFEVNQTLAKII